MGQEMIRKAIPCIGVLLLLANVSVSAQAEANANDVNGSWAWEANGSDINGTGTWECPCGYLNFTDKNSSLDSSQENATMDVQGGNWGLDGN